MLFLELQWKFAATGSFEKSPDWVEDAWMLHGEKQFLRLEARQLHSLTFRENFAANRKHEILTDTVPSYLIYTHILLLIWPSGQLLAQRATNSHTTYARTAVYSWTSVKQLSNAPFQLDALKQKWTSILLLLGKVHRISAWTKFSR